MFCARSFLLGKIKRYEELIKNVLEISTMRGIHDINMTSLDDYTFDLSRIDHLHGRESHSLSYIDGNFNEQDMNNATVENFNHMQGVLHKCNRSIEEKKNQIASLNEEFNNMMYSLMELSKDAVSLDGLKLYDPGKTLVNERGRSPLKKPNSYDNMADNKDKELDLPSQEEFGASSVRHGDEPDVAMSSSSKGPVDVVPISASTGSATEAKTPKRKNPPSPEEKNMETNRPSKFRTVEGKIKEATGLSDVPGDHDSHVEDEERNRICSSSPLEKRVTRSAAPRLDISDKFVKFRNAREKRQESSFGTGSKKSNIIDSDSSIEENDENHNKEPINRTVKYSNTDSSVSSEDDSFRSASKTIRSSRSKSSRTNTSKSQSMQRSDVQESADDEAVRVSSEDYFNRSRKGNKNRNKQKEIVSKEDTDKEKRYKIDEWLEMEVSVLGERCLSHLAEIERQRGLSSNLSGIVSGKMKDCSLIVANIIKALVEKVEVDGDVPFLKKENRRLSKELKKVKRKEEEQSKEIDKLRDQFKKVEKELCSLREGNNALANPSSPPLRSGFSTKPNTKPRVTYKENVSRDISKIQGCKEDKYCQSCDARGNTPGCSADEEYMNRNIVRTDGSEHMDLTMSSPPEGSNLSNARARLKEDNNNKKDIFKIPSLSKPRITSNVQLVPPQEEWKKVGNRRSFRRNRMLPTEQSHNSNASDSGPNPYIHKKQITDGIGLRNERITSKRRVNKPAVVTITGKPGGASYAEILGKAKDIISPKELGIEGMRMRRAVNGAIILELPGPKGKELASSLRNKLELALKEEAKINNPVAMGEIRLRGLDLATSEKQIREKLASISECPPGEIKISQINVMRDGMGVAWIQCPMEYALRIVGSGRIDFEWTMVRAELLKKRPVQCFRCWAYGHVKTNCNSEVDRTGCCFRCGLAGHVAQSCSEIAQCVVCKDKKKDFRHRMGSYKCLDNQGLSSGMQSAHRPVGRDHYRTQPGRDDI